MKKSTTRLTQFCSVSTVNIERLIALVDLSETRIEDQTVGAEFLFGDSISALVVLVALHLILVLSVFVVGTLELLGVCLELNCAIKFLLSKNLATLENVTRDRKNRFDDSRLVQIFNIMQRDSALCSPII